MINLPWSGSVIRRGDIPIATIIVVIPVGARSSSSLRLRTGIHSDGAGARIRSGGASDGFRSSDTSRQYRHHGEGLQDDDQQCKVQSWDRSWEHCE